MFEVFNAQLDGRTLSTLAKIGLTHKLVQIWQGPVKPIANLGTSPPLRDPSAPTPSTPR